MPFLRRIAPLLLFAGLTVLPVATDAQQGQRASVQDVSKAVRGEEEVPTGPGGVPIPLQTEDGRDLVYLRVVNITAIRDRRPARTYALWPRITVAKDANKEDIIELESRFRDALITSLTEVAQIDWPGPAMLDTTVAAALSKTRIDAIVDDESVDALDFIHVEVHIF